MDRFLHTTASDEGDEGAVSDVVINMLKEIRQGKDVSKPKEKRTKINIPPGASILAEDWNRTYLDKEKSNKNTGEERSRGSGWRPTGWQWMRR